MGNKKAAILSIFCGIWEVLLGAIILWAFIFGYFDIGSQYEKLPRLYSYLGASLSLLSYVFFIFLLVACGYFIRGGLLLYKDKTTVKKSLRGAYFIYIYYACLNLLSILLAVMARKFPAQSFKSQQFFITIIGSILIILPIIFLQRMLKPQLNKLSGA
jgi:hypothetical protein